MSEEQDQSKGSDLAPAEAIAPVPAERKRRRSWLRPVLLIAGPLAVLIGGAVWYYTGGRYVETENAYLQADKVAISAEVSGTIDTVAVSENQPVAKGDILFRIDAAPYRIAVDQAHANLESVRQDIRALKANYQQETDNLDLAKIDLAYAKRRYDRQSRLQKNNVVSQASLDDVKNAFDKAEEKVALEQHVMRVTLAKLGGDANTPVEKTPQFLQAKAALEKAELDLRRTSVRAPFAGIASKTPKPGQYINPGTAVMSLISTEGVWVDANFKETQLTHVTPGQSVEVKVDTYPGQIWQGTVASVAPATGSEFSVLPAQNATGNWVKVVQRIPVRIALDASAGDPDLRAGMSAVVEIDTHHQRELPGFAKAAIAMVSDLMHQGTAVAEPARTPTVDTADQSR
ncbi:HlyD family secretion protein [Amorphus sp. 3PC139-8]|uniref:HlyD family secretion protein n=1 Tax=Amorphus sp. 3PC139-8 TaxID=2735676 RepID=UPI00345DDB02